MSWENCAPHQSLHVIIPFRVCGYGVQAKQSDSILFLRSCVYIFGDLVKRGALTLVGEIQQHTIEILEKYPLLSLLFIRYHYHQ